MHALVRIARCNVRSGKERLVKFIFYFVNLHFVAPCCCDLAAMKTKRLHLFYETRVFEKNFVLDREACPE